ncbi:unnamed protein product [Orchesella dallaii]|uniref:Uncharacterized protein n=1 Tax=Orchesella dallaii TaxID=48710 RepID=A0ABP1RC04_9HEXA
MRFKVSLSVVLFVISNISFVICKNNLVGQKKIIHSGRIPANAKFYLGKDQDHPVDGSGVVRLVANSFPSTDLQPEHKLLYYRALQKDYDFAQFGQHCQRLSLEELEAFLRIPADDIESKEGELETMSPAQKGELLEKLFNDSKTICDFRNLLTCHKKFRTCSCAHPSMGLNREGICGINLGHPCDISERSLVKYNILLTPETNPIKCLLENAICTLDFGDNFGAGVSPIKKVCKCRDGFWGATCRRRRNSIKGLTNGKSGRNLDGSSSGGLPSEESMIAGRSLWNQDQNDALGEYFMHPEQIKDALLELMKEKNMYPPENREDEAQKLTKKLEFDSYKEEMVVHELHLRKLARLGLGDACEPERQVILDNPPIAKDGLRWVDPAADDIKAWQLGLLQNKKPFCNIHKHLRCDESTRTCQCKPGLTPQATSGGSCVIPLGSDCGPDFDTVLEFNPLLDRKRFSEALPPPCITKPQTECKDQPLFFSKKCWCKDGQNCNSMFNDDEFKSMVSALQSRFMLGVGDPCDPKLHQQLLSYNTDNDNPSHSNRMTLFREVIENTETRFCDINRYLNCSDISRTCECWKQLKPNKDGECVAINMASCGRTFEYGKYLYPSGSQLWQVERTFQSSFLPECIPGARCAGGDDFEWAGRCVCMQERKTGEDCKTEKSTLAIAFKANHIPSNNDEEMHMIREFYDLNRQTFLFEQLMTLTNNQVCDPDTGLKVDRIVKFWKDVASSDDNVADKQTVSHFIATTKWTKFLVSTVGKTASICNATVGLRCHHSSRKCGCYRGATWNGERCYLDNGERCDPKPGAEWVSKCANGLKCLPIRRQKGDYKCTKCTEGVDNCNEDSEDDEDGFAFNVELGTEDEDSGWISRPRGRSLFLQGRNVDGGASSQFSAEEDENEIPNSLFEEQLDPLNEDSDSSVEDKNEKEKGKEDENLTQGQKDKFILEIERMLQEILAHRMLSIGENCRFEEDTELHDILPNLPIYDMRAIPMSLLMTYSKLSKLYWNGISFCDRKNFLQCTSSGICGCSQKFGLVEDEGECKLMEKSFCIVDETINTNRVKLTRSLPELKCMRGTTCLRTDFGMAVCVKESEELKGQYGLAKARGQLEIRAEDSENSAIHLAPSYQLFYRMIIIASITLISKYFIHI